MKVRNTMTQKSTTSSIFMYLAVCLAPLFLMQCSDTPAEVAEPVRPVKTLVVYSGSHTDSTIFSGLTVAGSEVNLSFRVGGTLIERPVSVGTQVKKGDLIAKIDDKDARTNLQKIRLSLGSSRIQKETAQSNFNRVRELYENNSVSLNEYDAAKEKLAITKAKLDADMSALELGKREVGYYTLLAPMDGIITSTEFSTNENIQPGAVLAVLQTGNDMDVEVGIPDRIINRIHQSQTAELHVPGVENKVFTGEVIKISYSADTQTSTYLVTVEILNPSEDLRPGMAVEVVFLLPPSPEGDYLTIPPNSVGQDPDGNFVFVLNREEDDFGTVSKRKVETGGLKGDGILIISGLDDGDEVVTAGLSFLHDGKKIRVLK